MPTAGRIALVCSFLALAEPIGSVAAHAGRASPDAGCDTRYSDLCMRDPNSSAYREWASRDAGPEPEPLEEPVDRLITHDTSVIDSITARLPALKACIAKEHEESNYASGTVKMHWMIESDGRVSGVRVLNPQKRTIEPCLVQVIKSMHFPAHAGSPVPIDFPFRY